MECGKHEPLSALASNTVTEDTLPTDVKRECSTTVHLTCSLGGNNTGRLSIKSWIDVKSPVIRSTKFNVNGVQRDSFTRLDDGRDARHRLIATATASTTGTEASARVTNGARQFASLAVRCVDADLSFRESSKMSQFVFAFAASPVGDVIEHLKEFVFPIYPYRCLEEIVSHDV